MKDIMEENKFALGKGQKLYDRAKKIIPGGTMLLSKRPEMHLPEKWPAYFSKAQGCRVWDLDGREYIDMSIMGIGTNTLGYGHPEVDQAVRDTISKGNMSTLNCPEEVYLAEKLIEINPWGQMVRFARSGGEANAIAIRIARAASGKDNVAICGYHGWHDWYLSANHNQGDDLSNHLLSGLSPEGVPKHLKNSVFPFKYNDYDELKSIVEEQNIGVIKMEVERNYGPENNFLSRVRKLADDKGIILIFDECTSAFRETYGGIHSKYGVYPDMAMYGKTLGNGYAITAVVGKKEIMEAAQSTFISSTFWTERIGPTAALKSLEVMQRLKSWKTISDTGNSVRSIWKKMADKFNLPIELYGIPALSSFAFKSKNADYYRYYLADNLLENGFLAGTTFYSSIAHTDKELSLYESALEEVFFMLSKFELGEADIQSFIKGPLIHKGFKRLN